MLDAQLKARLEQRGVDASAAIPGAAFAAALPSPAPAAWVEATIRLAMQFAHGTTTRTASGLAVALAEEVLRAMLIGKIKVVVGMILFATVLVTGVVTWARQEEKKAWTGFLSRSPPRPRSRSRKPRFRLSSSRSERSSAPCVGSSATSKAGR